jgi:alpha-amylase/alpha-mannosidase (GH57 family)
LPVFLGRSSVDIAGTDSAFAVALHMHQPLIPAGGPDPRTAAIVSNLQWMLEHPELGDNHNAPVFHWCYQRMGELIPQLLAEGSQLRVMLEYSGTLLHGLRRAGLDDVVSNVTVSEGHTVGKMLAVATPRASTPGRASGWFWPSRGG